MLLEVNENQYQKIALNLAQRIGKSDAVEPINTSIPNRCLIFVDAAENPKACAVLYFPELKYLGKKSCFFGNFICIKEQNIFADFFSELEKIAVAAKAQYFTGPISGSTWNNYRWSLRGDTALFPGDVSNPDFYPVWIQDIGYEVISQYQTSRDNQLTYDKETTARKSAHLAHLKWNIRSLDSNHIDEELSNIYHLSTTAFADNFLFSPISKSDFIAKYKAWLQLIPSEMILLAEDEKGKLLGFLLAYPDANNGAKRGVVIKTLARRPENEYRGIGLMLCQRLYDFLKVEKYDYALHALMRQTNYSIKTSATLSGTLEREYALFGKQL